MSLKEAVAKMKGFLAGRTPTDQLPEIEAEIAKCQRERDQLAGGRPAAVLAKMQGDGDAAARVERIDAETEALDARLRDLRDAAGQARRLITAEAEAQRRREAGARPRRIAELRAERLALMEGVTQRMQEAAEAMRATARNGERLAAVLDIQTINNFLSFGAFRARARAAFARTFAIDPTDQLTARNNLLGIESSEHGERAHWTVAQHEETGLDDLAPYFLTREAADEAKARLEARRTKTIAVALPGGIWTLVPIEFTFAERSVADRAVSAEASRGRRMSVVGQDGGFVLVPERFSGEAA